MKRFSLFCLHNFFVLFILASPIISFTAFQIRHIYLTFDDKDLNSKISINVHTTENINKLDLYLSEKSFEQTNMKNCLHIRQRGKQFYKDRYLFNYGLKNLTPGKTYFFIVGNQKIGFSKERKFKTIDGDAKNFRFIVGGDLEQGVECIPLYKIAAKYNPSAAFLGGDYPDNITGKKDYTLWDEWLDAYTNHMIDQKGHLIPLICAIGNHDVIDKKKNAFERAPFYFSYLPQTKHGNKSYFLKHINKDITLFVLDSGHIYSHNGIQYEWLKDKLKKYHDKKVKIALYHIPIFPSVRFIKKNKFFDFVTFIDKIKNGNNHYSSQLFSKNSYLGKKYWLPLFNKHKLTVAFEHHDHTLKRTKLIRYNIASPYGIVFLGDGCFAPKVQCTPFQAYLNCSFAKAMGHIQFFWLMDITDKKIEYHAINKSNKIIDRFTQKLKF